MVTASVHLDFVAIIASRDARMGHMEQVVRIDVTALVAASVITLLATVSTLAA